MKKITLFFFAAILISTSCKKTIVATQLDTSLDKEIRIPFPVAGGFFQIPTFKPPTYMRLPASYYIYDFNKQDYPGVDSITFNFNGTVFYPKVAMRLYNITDSNIVSSSIVNIINIPIGGAFFKGELTSNNIYNSLPNKKVTLEILCSRPESVWPGNTIVEFNGAFLKLRRN